MWSSFSGRPDTIFPITSDAAQSDSVTSASDEGAPGKGPAPFIPNVFDIVYMARRAELSLGNGMVIQPFLAPQAIDQSTYLGHGASFEASSKKIPKFEGVPIEVKTTGMTITHRQGESKERTLVYKTAKVTFSDLGEPGPNDRRALNAFLMELHALLHPPLREHANIVTLLGLGWGSNPYDITYRMPVLVTEFADHGNLAELQDRQRLDSQTKLNLTLDIAHGLQVLHKCGIIHGDVKSENVLIFSHPQKKYVAKLADFGFSVVGAVAAESVRIGGTAFWKAPEADAWISRPLLVKSDIYSFGLTIWRIAVEGMNPFQVLCDGSSSGENMLNQIDRLKKGDVLKDLTGLESWYLKWIYRFYDGYTGSFNPTMAAQIIRQLQHAMANNVGNSEQLAKMGLWLCHRMGMPESPLLAQLRLMLLTITKMDPFYSKLSTALEKCLMLDPTARDLDGVIAAFEGHVSNTETHR